MPVTFIKDDFNDLIEYQHWLSQAWENLSPKNAGFRSGYAEQAVTRKIQNYPEWFGADVSYRELADGITRYKDPELIETLYSKVTHEVSPEISNRIQSRKLRFNALGLGIFCFDRAAMTLHRVRTESGEMKVRTATKELFAWFPQQSRERHAVELYVSCDVPANAEAGDMLYSGISAIVMAELLIKAGIRVKINIVIGSARSASRQEYVGCVIPVKDYDQPFDRNVTALLTSDPRFMRFDAFRGVIAAFDHFNKATPLGMGYSMNAAQLKTLFEQSGYTKKSQARHRYYFGGTLSEQQALRDVSHTINDLADKLKDK